MQLASRLFQSVTSTLSGIWAWFTCGQHATAVGIIAATLMSGFSLYVLFRTLLAINRQAEAAEAQAEAANAQAEAARKQTEVSEQLRIASERAAVAAEEQVKAALASTAVSEAQRKAAEESARANRAQSELTRHQTLSQLRPVLVFGTEPHPTQGGAMRHFIENHGIGTAFKISIQYIATPGSPNVRVTEVSLELTVLGPNRRSVISYRYQQGQEGQMQAKYDSQDGRHFATTAQISQGSFRDQKVFETNERGGWLPETAIPSLE